MLNNENTVKQHFCDIYLAKSFVRQASQSLGKNQFIENLNQLA